MWKNIYEDKYNQFRRGTTLYLQCVEFYWLSEPIRIESSGFFIIFIISTVVLPQYHHQPHRHAHADEVERTFHYQTVLYVGKYEITTAIRLAAVGKFHHLCLQPIKSQVNDVTPAGDFPSVQWLMFYITKLTAGYC